ncbi:MAG TPA: efflux RND transporter periplasmic adaptor subunit [Vicinamibacterales bacterium]|nr:efflux RND transporter periplasmic adaptor subunit [Vicinamibacterales bacterium]
MRLRFPQILGYLIIFAAVGTSACSEGTPAQAAGDRGGTGTPAVPVATATVEQKAMPLALGVIGTAEAYSNVAVRSQITGSLTSVNFKEGDDVTKGQVLFTLDRRPLEGALQQAEATLQRDTAQLAQAKSTAARFQDLQSRGIATKEQADVSRTSAAALEATLQSDRAAVENAKVQLQYATITSPISGRTGALIVDEGNLVRANDTTPLVIINQVAPIYVSFGIPEGRLPELRRYLEQGTVRVEATPPGETTASNGRITFIDNAVDATTGQIRVKAAFPNVDRRLWPGQFANVTVTLRTDPTAIVVPSAAIQTGQQGNYVFVLKPDMTVEQRTVTVQRQVADTTVVENGLKPDEMVVTDGQLRLVPGTRVTIKAGPGAESSPKVEP